MSGKRRKKLTTKQRLKKKRKKRPCLPTATKTVVFRRFAGL